MLSAVDARDLTEKQLAGYLRAFCEQLALRLITTEVRLGAYRFDGLAEDVAGMLVVVELKTVASKDVLGQLLLYPHSLRKWLASHGVSQPVRSLLITTHLDSNVVEVVQELQPLSNVALKVCVGSAPDGLRLVDPTDAPNQVWDQAAVGDRCDIRVIDGRVIVRRM